MFIKKEDIMADSIEVWLPIKGYEELYEVSNKGRVKSLERWVNTKGGAKRHVRERLLVPNKNIYNYPTVVLSKQAHKTFCIHILMGKAFLPNPNNLPQINHKDENKSNNFIWVNPDGSIDQEKSNLEWCSVSYNVNYGTHNKRVAKALGFPVIQKLNGNIIAIYESIHEAGRQTGIAWQNICKCCKGLRNTAGGYSWEFVVS